ncbi:hypothetical protein GE061_013079 [Apolygus lucorum]|uniref:Uncharacterized protein n=1 Tax=Apolygus lucorum TaxID=248454 RepID=A0A8S9XVD4_APOLU|nr:hypothetical protein GE061_013079 [Apolygus lucorum]
MYGSPCLRETGVGRKTRLATLLFLLAVVSVASAQTTVATEETTSATPPVEVDRVTGRPPDMANCRIDANTVLSYIVAVWDESKKYITAHGSMITYIAFVTSCKRINTPENYVAVGQFVWNISEPEDPCYQERHVHSVHKHPLCVYDPKTATFFDYSVMTLRSPFLISGPNFPTMGLPLTPYDLFTSIRYINVLRRPSGCLLPYFRSQTKKPPIFSFESFVVSIPFHTQCVKLLCERFPEHRAFTTMCSLRFIKRAKGTMLCLANENGLYVQLGIDHLYWYTGTPLVCNGSAYGMATQLKERKGFPKNATDIHFAVTFLRVWQWLIDMKKLHSAPWVKYYYLEDAKIKPHGGANMPAPSPRNLALVLLIVATRWATDRSGGSVLHPDTMVGGRTVVEVLRSKHPPQMEPNRELFDAAGELPLLVDVNIAASHIERAAHRLRGSAGPSGTDAQQWRDMLLRFGSHSQRLREAIAAFTRSLANGIVNWNSIKAFLARRAVALDKLSLAFAQPTFLRIPPAPSEYPPPPPEYPPETGRPRDMKHCRININTLLPYVVGVLDRRINIYVGHGSLITHNAFVTCCRTYSLAEHYKAIGQFIWNISLPEDPCMQEKLVKKIHKHPRCVSSPKEATFFDFSVMTMIFPLEITGAAYPTMHLPSTPFDLFIRIQAYNDLLATSGCRLPYFRNQEEQPPVFDFGSFVELIPFFSQCVRLLCERNPPDAAFSRMCQKRFGERANGTMLCLKNTDRKPIRLGSSGEYWYAGTPLVCNDSALGMAAQAKERKSFKNHNSQDIHFVVTFLRVWPWLIGQRQNHTAPWVRPFNIEDLKPLMIALYHSITAQTPVPTPPKVYPPETGRPKNLNNCRLNANTVFPYVVGVWDSLIRQFIGVGSMLTYSIFITTCRHYRQHTGSPTKFKAVGQFVWNQSRSHEPCMQEKSIEVIIVHPKCIKSRQEATFFDFSIIRLASPFGITGPTYPTAALASTAYELLKGIQHVNIVPDTVGCTLPYFKDLKVRPPVLEFQSLVRSIPFYSRCVGLLCEQEIPNPEFTIMCWNRFGQRAKGTMLCMKDKNPEKHIDLDSYGNYWYAGTPLVCNSSTYGIAAQAKIRKAFKKPNSEDIHFIVTFLRVWPWLVQHIKENSPPWVRPVHIEDKNFVAEEFLTPERVPIDDDDQTVAPMRYNELFVVIVLGCSVFAQKPTIPTPPDIHPPETGRPADFHNCRFNANTVFPWIVGVWDQQVKQYVGLGSMITWIAFVTTCRQYTKEGTDYLTIGQFLWNMSLPREPCMQTRRIEKVYKHPKCMSSPQDATFFDFSVWKLTSAFEITGPNYPTTALASSPVELLAGIQYINVAPNTTGCMLPYFRNSAEQPPVFDFKSVVESIPFYSKCIPLLCEKSPPDPQFTTMCTLRFELRAKGTMLCMTDKNSTRKHIPLNSDGSYWYAGTPLVCNGSTFGLAAQAKIRKDFPRNTTDINFIVTFLRVWPWLVDRIEELTARWYNIAMFFRHVHFVILTLLVGVHAETRPPWVPKRPPGNKLDCVLHAKALFSWIVGVWSDKSSRFIGLGSMITHVSFITTCRQYDEAASAYKAVGQNIWNQEQPFNPCMQKRPISEIHKHPKCAESPKLATFFDFAVFKLNVPFNVTERTYPTAFYPNLPLTMWGMLKLFDLTPNTTDCFIPHFKNPTEEPPKFNFRTQVEAIPFRKNCTDIICELNPPVSNFRTMCLERFNHRFPCTMVCAKYKHRKNFDAFAKKSYWFAGAPLICNSTTLGLAAQGKIREDYIREPKFDFHFVVTFLRPWVWLAEKKRQFSPTWKDYGYMENITDKDVSVPNIVTDLPRTTELYDDAAFDQYYPLSKAIVQEPFLCHLVLPLLQSFMFTWL